MERGMNDRLHEDLREGLGAYTLNAMDEVEHRRIERHLSECEECANEVRLLKEAAGELAWLSGPAETSELVDRMSTRLPARRRQPIAVRILSGVAAVAVIVAGLFGAGFVRERNRSAELVDVLASAARLPLDPQSGFGGRGVLHVSEDRAALVLDGMPDPGRERTYQLWAIQGATPSSLAVLDGRGRIVRLFDWDGKADRFAVTIEPAGGSPVPTSDPVLVGA